MNTGCTLPGSHNSLQYSVVVPVYNEAGMPLSLPQGKASSRVLRTFDLLRLDEDNICTAVAH